MASDAVMADYSAMETAAGGFNTSAGKLEATMSDLDQRLNALLAVFTGKAATEFRAHHAALDTGMDEMRGVIAKMGSVVGEAQVAYAQADQQAAGLFS